MFGVFSEKGREYTLAEITALAEKSGGKVETEHGWPRVVYKDVMVQFSNTDEDVSIEEGKFVLDHATFITV